MQVAGRKEESFCCDMRRGCAGATAGEGISKMIIGNKTFDTENGYYIMGILNVTPDSFSDGGKWDSIDAARAHALQMAEEGASIIDIGGESTRPGYEKISDEEEAARVVPVIEAVKRDTGLPVSLDTYKSAVAEAGLAAGADMINDIWGFKYDPAIAAVTARAGAACCLMQNREKAEYDDLMRDLMADLSESVRIAITAGVPKEKIMIDPGIGFGKTYEHNLEVMADLQKLGEMGYPVLLGTSRKSMIGLTLDLPADQRLEGTIATTVIGMMKGCRFFRVHDVKENMRALKMTEAILNA